MPRCGLDCTELSVFVGVCAQNGMVRPVETQRILQREVLAAYTTNQRLVLQASQLQQDIQRLELINNQLIAADAAATATTTAATTLTTTTTSSAVVGMTPAGKSQSGSMKGTKRKSGGSPVTPACSVEASASSEKLKEKLEMKENLEAYSQRVNKLKSEVTAALTESIDGISSLTRSSCSPVTSSIGEASRAGQSHPSLGGSIKQEVKFQPPDLSIKGLLEKTKTLPNGAMKHETVATTAFVSSSVSSSATLSDVLLQSVVKSEAREVVNGAKRRKTLNGIVLPPRARSPIDNASSSNLQYRGNTAHSSVPGSSPLSSSSSSTPLLATSSSQDGKPSSPWADERLTLARDLIRFHETPVQQAAPPVMTSALVSSVPTAMITSCAAASDEVFSSAVTSSAETHRLQNNYSPISRPSSQSSTEGMELPASMSSAAAISRITQSLTSQSTSLPEASGLLHQSSATGGRLGLGLLPLSTVPLTVKVDVGAMSGGCMSARPLLPAPMALPEPQFLSSSKKTKAAAHTGSTPVLASALDMKGSNSSNSRLQATPPVYTSSSLQPEQQIIFQQQGQVVVQYQAPPEMSVQSIPARSISHAMGKHPTCFEVSTPSTTAMLVPLSMAAPSPTVPTSGNRGSLINHTITQKPQPPPPAAKPQQRRKNQRSHRASQSRQLQPQTTQPSHQVASLPNGMLPASHAHQEVAKMLGASVIAPSGDGAVQMAMVNGVAQPVRFTAMPQTTQVANNQKGEWGFFCVFFFFKSWVKQHVSCIQQFDSGTCYCTEKH